MEYVVLEQRAAMSISASSNRGASICSGAACPANLGNGMIPKSVGVNASALLVGRNSWREGAPCDAKLHGRPPHKM